MKVADIMSYNVVTIPSSTSISDAKRIMEAHHYRRLPVVDKGKLVGIVTDRNIETVSPSKATSLSVWELSYLLEHTPVRDIMRQEVVVVPPDMDAEEAVAMAQKNKVGSAVVVENGKVVGIVSNDDFFYNIINPLLGIGEPGYRIEITGGIVRGGGGGQLEKMIAMIHKWNFRVATVHIEGPSTKQVRDVCFHIEDSDKVEDLMNDFRKEGYKVRIRNR
jgi:acetoin utilization protein AcuB